MIIKHKILEKYNNYTFALPYGAEDQLLVSKNTNIRVGTELLRKRTNVIMQSFYIPEQIGGSKEDSYKYITCIDGELVTKGTVLAERLIAGGLNVKKLISPIDGVIDLDRIGSGYLDILGEENIAVVKSSFTGKVIDTNPFEGIKINTSAEACDIKLISDTYAGKNEKLNKKVFGEFVFLGNGKELLLKAEDIDYHDKIVFVGKYLHTSLLYDLFEKGASFVLTYSMDYRDFRKQGLPIGILGGFGEIFYSESILNTLDGLRGTFAIVDYKESQIFFLNNHNSKKSKDSIFIDSLENATVRSLSLANYSMIGTVIGLADDPSFINVRWENGLAGIINIANVEFVSI